MNEGLGSVYPGSTVPRDAFAEALATFYFGSPRREDSLGRYIDRAYRDMNRTLRLSTLGSDARRSLRATATSAVRDATDRLSRGEGAPSAELFDAWHQRTCDELKATYSAASVDFTYGQAQKWVNMTLKYVFVALALDLAAPLTLRPYYGYAHLPIDSLVLEALRRRSFDSPFAFAWSRQDDYPLYLDFQRSIRTRFGSGLDAEMTLWRPLIQPSSDD